MLSKGKRHKVVDVTTKRPYFGLRQVKTLKGIVPGLILREVNAVDSSLILVLSHPYEDDLGWRFDYVSWPLRDGLDFQKGGFCVDRGILPYSNGLWNGTNHLLRTWSKKRSKKKIAEIKKRLTLFG